VDAIRPRLRAVTRLDDVFDIVPSEVGEHPVLADLAILAALSVALSPILHAVCHCVLAQSHPAPGLALPFRARAAAGSPSTD